MTTSTLTAKMTPAPTVTLTAAALPATTVSVFVWRQWGSQAVRVQGDSLVVVAGQAFAIDDFQVPPGQAVSYKIESYSAAGALLETYLSGSVTPAAITNPATAWLMDVADPSRALLVSLMDGTGATIRRDGPGSLMFPLDGSAPAWISGPRTPSARPFAIRTTTLADANAMEQMLAPNGVLLLRPSSSMRHLTGLFYIAAAAVDESPEGYSDAPTEWSWNGQEVAPDDWGVVVPIRTWADVKAQFATWADVKAQRATWLDVRAG
ncbi:MAG: hypothetical protein ACOH10_08015 [Rhodoglobus sp.]